MEIHWTKDQKIEHHLRQLQIKFDARNVAMSNIDLEAAANRQVRLGEKIKDDWVIEYAEQIDSAQWGLSHSCNSNRHPPMLKI